MNDNDNKAPIEMSIDEIKTLGATIAAELKSASSPLPPDLRARFIHVRAALFQRGIYDPVLVRFDSATVPQASAAELGEQLSSIVASL
ncbi:MAG TPA: hypothetical protein VF980_15050 [Thermoanaerobaculia bacterium]